MRRATAFLCTIALVACGGGRTATSTTLAPTVAPAPSASSATTTPADTTNAPETPLTVPTTTTVQPATQRGDEVTLLVVDADGVHRDGRTIVGGPVAWAADDTLGGVVYLPAGGGATIRWFPAGAVQPIDTGLPRGIVGTTATGPALVTPNDAPIGDECGDLVGDGEVHAVNARPLDPTFAGATGTGPPELVTCNHEGADDGYVTVSYRDGHLLQIHNEAAGWQYNDRELALVGPGDVPLALPASTFGHAVAWFEQQRELDAELSPDASLIAVRQRLDNAYSNGPDPVTGEVDPDEWERLTAAIPSTIRVVELATGEVRYQTQVPYGVELGDFDGRHLVLIDGTQSTIVDTLGATTPTTLAGIVSFIRPNADSTPTLLSTTAPVAVERGDAGPWVSHLQLRLLVHEPAVGLAVDGEFGPATETAVTDFQRSHGLAADGVVGATTWAELSSEPREEPASSAGRSRPALAALGSCCPTPP